ncbi:MAG: DUF1015 domain-containing protein [Acidobacteriia bacterium]|nr:DUF1015 domain-containing protein [Terriglobia bacterium]
MAEIYPFRALHYNLVQIPDLSKLVTQPYDKITPAMQARYYEASPRNLVRIIRGRTRPEDDKQDNIYVRAAGEFQAWIENRVLVSEAEPALYLYDQEYEVPGQPGVRKKRRGFIALLRLEDYSARVVHRHEETLSGPKADRLDLLRATRAHFGKIFMLYRDPEGVVEGLLAPAARQKPWEQATDEYATVHSVWRVADPQTIERVVAALRDKPLVIADGHHRYETALAYRDECREQQRPDGRAEYVMVTLIRMETDGLTILPTHRVVHGLPSFDWPQFTSAARTYFDWGGIPPSEPRETQVHRVLGLLAQVGRERPTLGAYAGPGRAALLRLRRDRDLGRMLPELPAGLRGLDVVILHRLVLEKILGIDRQAVREEKNISYYREFEAAAAEVDQGRAAVCFALNPTPVEAVCDNALAGQVLPQKSTDFYPKLLSGLAGYWLDNPNGL